MICGRYYPKECYHIREDITRQNMRDYDRKQEALYKKCLEIEPNYYSLNLIERMKIRHKAEENLVW